ncbi:MAG: hypothetical protein Q7R92_02870 [bacterium]|nr:hypothetical protein [bacterium]
MKTKIILAVIILALAAGNIIFAASYFFAAKNLAQAQAANSDKQKNQKILEFNKLFIQEVLGAGKEVGFESRLKLENAVRGLNDQEILSDWQKFTASKDPAEAQKNVLLLLKALANKM